MRETKKLESGCLTHEACSQYMYTTVQNNLCLLFLGYVVIGFVFSVFWFFESLNHTLSAPEALVKLIRVKHWDSRGLDRDNHTGISLSPPAKSLYIQEALDSFTCPLTSQVNKTPPFWNGLDTPLSFFGQNFHNNTI